MHAAGGCLSPSRWWGSPTKRGCAIALHTSEAASPLASSIRHGAGTRRRRRDPLASAIRTFGGEPDRLAASVRRPDELLGYVEVHIEQGPVLEEQGYPVGLVSAIQGQSGVGVTFTGVAGHAGTVPMAMRHDALVPPPSSRLQSKRLHGRRADSLPPLGDSRSHPAPAMSSLDG